MAFLFQFLLTATLIWFSVVYNWIPGIHLQNGYNSALIFSVLLALINIFLGTFLRIITFPIRLLTLGLFSFVILLIVVFTADQLVPVIELQGAIPVIGVALIMSITVFILKIFR